MPDTARARTGLQASLGTDDLRTVDNTMRTAFDLLELIIALDSQGTLASRPSASKRGQYYWATDGGPLGTGWLYRDTGSAWKACSPETVITAMLAAGAVTADKLADAAKLGLTDSSDVRRGKSIIATSESRTSASYGLLSTPDRVQNVVLPTDGLIHIAYQALWKGPNTSKAAIFLGSNQLKIASSGYAPQAAETAAATGSWWHPLVSAPGNGLVSTAGADPGQDTGSNVTTGQLIGHFGAAGGIAAVFAAAGTYDVSVQFKSGGTVSVKERALRVWTVGF